jgi:hypothetical protein
MKSVADGFDVQARSRMAANYYLMAASPLVQF